MKKTNYYVDMDGVLAKYDMRAYIGENPEWLKRKAHYFRELEPDNKMINVLENLCKQTDKNVIVLTSIINVGDLYLEHLRDKKEWLRVHCPFIDQNTQFIATISAKKTIAETINSGNITFNDILIDDFNNNLNMWKKAGGQAIKYLNGINSPNETNKEYTYDGMNLSQNLTSSEIMAILEAMTPRLFTKD